MKDTNIKSYSDHLELSHLLPWYVNKSLQGAELKAVENHLGVCFVCNRELIQLQKLAQVVKATGALDSTEHASFSRLKKRLHTAPQLDLKSLPQQQKRAEQPASKNNVTPLGGKQVSKLNLISRPALAMAAALLLTLTVLMPRFVGNDAQSGNLFRTLSDAQPKAVVPTAANEIRVVFAENVPLSQKSNIIDRVHGSFVDNAPTAQGVYTVSLGQGVAVKQLLEAVDLLRKDSNVIFVEPAYALLSSTYREK